MLSALREDLYKSLHLLRESHGARCYVVYDFSSVLNASKDNICLEILLVPTLFASLWGSLETESSPRGHKAGIIPR